MTRIPTAAPAAEHVGDPAGLRRALAEIDRIGWDSQAGDAVLGYAHDEVVGPAIGRAGLTGSRAEDAAGAGWVAVWQVLNRPDLRDQPSPWGIAAAAVRREIAEDLVSAAHRTNPRRAWRLARLHRVCTDPAREKRSTGAPAAALGVDPEWVRRLDPTVAARQVSLDRLTEHGWDAPAATPPGEDLGPRLSQVVAALVGVGWSPSLAADSVAWIAEAAAAAAASRAARSAELPGWRELARHTGLPSWRTRRLAALLLGYRGTPGLIAAMVRDGDQFLLGPEAQRGLRSTVHRWAPSPCADAATAATRPRRVAA
jgi:hypothetical protein